MALSAAFAEKEPKVLKKILIISLKHLGDIITTTSVLPLLKKYYPHAAVHYMVNPEGVQLIEKHPLVSAVHVAYRHKRIKDTMVFLQAIRREKFDLILDYSEGDRGALWGLLSGAPERIGYRSKLSHVFRNWSHTALLPDRSKVFDRHVCDCHVEALELLGFPPVSYPLPTIFFSDTAIASAEKIMDSHGVDINSPYCVAHFTACDAIRYWPVENCLEAIDYLSERVGPVLLVSGDYPVERAFMAEIVSKTVGKAVDMAGRFDLEALMAVLDKSRLFIGLDSMVGHMAGALQRPVVSLFGPASDVHWAPRGQYVKVAHADKSCRPCVRGGCLGDQRSACMEELSFHGIVRPLVEELLCLKI